MFANATFLWRLKDLTQPEMQTSPEDVPSYAGLNLSRILLNGRTLEAEENVFERTGKTIIIVSRTRVYFPDVTGAAHLCARVISTSDVQTEVR